MVHHVEIGGYQIDRIRQVKATNILPEHMDVRIAQSTLRSAEHFRRTIYGKDRHSQQQRR